MAAGMYLEHYLDSIENLPFELQRNFQLMRDLDQRTEDLKGQIDSLARDYTANARTLSSEQKLSLLRQIQQSYGKCKEFGDDKVQLAMQTYEMVDKHIRRLDTDLARFEADLKEKQIESTDYDSTSSKGNKSDLRGPKEKKVSRTRSKVKNSDDDCSPKSGQKKVKLTQTSEFSSPAVNFGNVHPSDVLDMPVDPNEPTYCLCHQVSYGEMIGCDNTDFPVLGENPIFYILAVKVKTEFMPDFEHFRFSYSRMNPVLGESAHAVHQPQNPGMSLLDSESVYASTEPGFFFSEFGQDGLDSGFWSSSFPYSHSSGLLHRASLHPPPPPPPAAAALRNDLGSNISVLKTLNLRFRCFLAKVHELERRNKALEHQLQQAREANNNDRGCGQGKKNVSVQSGLDFTATINGNDSACWTRTLSGPTTNSTAYMPRNKILVGNLDSSAIIDSNSNLSPSLSPDDPKPVSSIRQSYDEKLTNSASLVHPTSVWFHSPLGRFNNSLDWRVSAPRASWPYQDGVGVQIDTVTPEIRALNNVLAKVKLERDEYKQRWEEEYAVRVDLQEKIAELEEDLYMSEMCQDKLALRVKQLKAELIVFKGLMSNNLSELDSKIQEKAMKVDMDICRRIDITARLCDVAQQRNCEDMTQIFQASQTIKPNNNENSVSMSVNEESKNNEAELCGSSTDPVDEEMQRMLNQLHECEFEDDCDSLAWEETEETLLLWGDFPGYAFTVDTNGEVSLSQNTVLLCSDFRIQQDESLEKVIKDTESMFKSREKEYQETIDQIELELATAKSDMNRHLHEYMEICSMKRGLDVQMETCRRLITQSGDRKSSTPISVTLENAEVGERERKKAGLLSDSSGTESCYDNLNNPSFSYPPWRKS
ncbi:Intermediate filament family orphan 1 [Bagarius yarrelli]|uniref:Intermediate filament family orphan 1 n=1 Tax=Bagarius yarrelli TaxID=175774 RepID=A0A556U9B3_BAGYA|nr:Intermediate filament family orphan 1 [Bagarius yarrelli]